MHSSHNNDNGQLVEHRAARDGNRACRELVAENHHDKFPFTLIEYTSLQRLEEPHASVWRDEVVVVDVSRDQSYIQVIEYYFKRRLAGL